MVFLPGGCRHAAAVRLSWQAARAAGASGRRTPAPVNTSTGRDRRALGLVGCAQRLGSAAVVAAVAVAGVDVGARGGRHPLRPRAPRSRRPRTPPPAVGAHADDADARAHDDDARPDDARADVDPDARRAPPPLHCRRRCSRRRRRRSGRPPRPLPGPPDEEPPDHFEPLTGSFLAAQIAEADRITAALNASTVQGRRGRPARWTQLADKSNALLESLDAAREAERAATEEAQRARADLVALDARLEAARAVVREWVFLGLLRRRAASSDVGVHARRHGGRARGRRRPARRPVLPHRAAHPGACRTSAILTAEQVRLSAAADTAKAEAAAATRTIAGDSSALAEGPRASSAPGSGSSARSRSPRSSRPAPSRASSSAPARRRPARRPQRLRDALTAASSDVVDDRQAVHQRHEHLPQRPVPPERALPPVGRRRRAAGPRGRRRVQRAEQGVCRPDRRAAVRHRLLPLAVRADLGQGHTRPASRPLPEPAGTGWAARSTSAAASRTSARRPTGG